MRRVLLALLWAAATLLATAVSWVGVSTVTDAVSDTPSPAIPPARVIALVEPSTTTTSEAVTSTTTTAPTTTTTPARHREGPVTTTTAPPAPTTTVAAHRTATFAGKGGSITVSCDGDRAGLLSASPADGYQVVVNRAGPDRVDVSFRGEEDGTRLVAHCESGTPANDPPPPPPPRDRRGPGPGR